MIDRARGALVGMAVGDAVGAPVEFESPERIAGRRDELFGLPGGGPFHWASGEFTDDTQMAIVLARHLIEQDGTVDQGQLARRFATWAGSAKDVGMQTRRVLSVVQGGGDWARAAADLPPDAAGNGSLMRVAPVALAGRTSAEAAQLGRAQAAVTHPNASCLDATGLFAAALWEAIAGSPLRLEALAERATRADVRGAVLGAHSATPPAMSGWVIDTLSAALWAVEGARDFSDALWRAVSLGRDADTVGAVAGALAGAHWGYEAIPTQLSRRLTSHMPMCAGTYPDLLLELADSLLALR